MTGITQERLGRLECSGGCVGSAASGDGDLKGQARAFPVSAGPGPGEGCAVCLADEHELIEVALGCDNPTPLLDASPHGCALGVRSIAHGDVEPVDERVSAGSALRLCRPRRGW